MSFAIRRADEHVRRPWRNGGGMTAEVAAWPRGADAASDFDWRVSFAEVAGSGDFSRFPGVDRVITLLDGPTMTLQFPVVTELLIPFRPLAFDGGLPVSCTVDGPTRDLNVMTRRGRCTATVEIIDLMAPQHLDAADPLLLVALTGTLSVSVDGEVADLHDGDVLTTDRAVGVRGGCGRCAVVRINAGPEAGMPGPAAPAC